jgi:hypothetical protein
VLIVILLTPDFFRLSSYTFRPFSLPENAWLMLFTMACLPIFFQFVDMSNWQRLSSLAGTPEAVMKKADSGLRFFLLESPLSWLFPIAMGMSAAKFLTTPTGGDPWVAFVEQAVAVPGTFGAVLAVVTVVGILCVFLSTADALLSASGYAFAYDIDPRSRKIMDVVHQSRNGLDLTEEQRVSVVNAGKYATSAAIVFAAFLYIVVDSFYSQGTKILGFFLTFYAPMLSFAPSMVVPIITGRAANRWISFWSMSVSATSGVGIGIFSLFSSDEMWQWLGVPVCFTSSWAIYLAGFFFSSREIEAAQVPSPTASTIRSP